MHPCNGEKLLQNIIKRGKPELENIDLGRNCFQLIRKFPYPKLVMQKSLWHTS
jgi:hypothetical protein